MPLSFSQLLALALSITPISALPHKRDAVDTTQLLRVLTADPSAIARFQRLLVKDGTLISGDDLSKATIFDFNHGGFAVPGSNGGSVTGANPTTFPILSTANLNVNLATVGPCGVLAPHVHPRANEFFIVVDGEARFGYVLESGLLASPSPDPEIRGTMKKNMGTLFPQGSVHWQVNDSQDCRSFTAVVMLDSRDPGTTPVLLGSGGGIGEEKRDAGEGEAEGKDLGGLRGVLPERIVEVVDRCRARCGLA